MFYLKSSIILIICQLLIFNDCKQNLKGTSIEEVSDIKDFKKILRTKTNVLTLFVNNHKRSAPVLKVFKDAADIVKGEGTMLLVDCSAEGKKLCKKLKVGPESYSIRHYKDGEFNKEYDRKESVQSIVNFMKDPTGDLPWEEEPSATNVTHVSDPKSLQRLLKREQKPVMVMFYAPWCGFCKRLKPDYAAAASELKDYAVLAAIDVNRPENAAVRVQHNITGFPTLQYFQNGELKYTYDGDNNKEKLVEFVKNPQKRSAKRGLEWSETATEVKHLTLKNFDSFIAKEPSVLVMFFAPWCGHCQKMKPEYEAAAAQLKKMKINGVLAAVDATKETELASRYNVSGYPTVKYFRNGSFAYDTPHLRETKKLIDFMKSPDSKYKRAPPEIKETPWTEEQSEVVHLTTENIKGELRKKRHGLVMFYAPWCGHCKNAKPEYVSAAEQLKDNTRVILGAVDCSKHDTLCKLFNVKGYPTFKYFHYYNKASADYDGGRIASDFVKYINNADINLQQLLKSKDEL